MAKNDDKKNQWIADTQMFQRIAQIEESTVEELEADWAEFNAPRKLREALNIETNLIILKVAGGTEPNKGVTE
jgi:hypothetical protein